MTTTSWVTRVVAALLALGLLVGSLLALVEIVAAALGRGPALVPYPEWTDWLRTHSWNDWIITAVLGGLVVLGLLLLLLAFHRGKPGSLALKSHSEGVDFTASRRSVEKSLAAAAARTNGVADASAAVGRRTARVNARTLASPDPGLHEEVEAAIRGRLDSFALERPMRTRVGLFPRGTR